MFVVFFLDWEEGGGGGGVVSTEKFQFLQYRKNLILHQHGFVLNEPPQGKTNNLPSRKQRRRSASQ